MGKPHLRSRAAAISTALAAGVAGALLPLGVAFDPSESKASGKSGGQKPTIVLVHGSFADGTSWEQVIERLQARGYNVIAPANPLRSLSGDAAYIRSVLDQTPGPIVLVAHSYGGAVITNAAAGSPNVKRLVYIDGFLPDVGEDALSLVGRDSQVATAIEGTSYPPFGAHDQEFTIRADVFHDVFSQDLDEKMAGAMWAAQRPTAAATFGEPTTAAAWKTIPASALIGRQDHVVSPDALRSMAERAHASVVEIDSSHVPMISQPDRVAEFIMESVEAATAAAS
ncbi:MAG: alpha/beta fold hydrolase [Hyphomicrobiales bacterium]